MKNSIATLCLSFALIGNALAHEYKLGSLIIDHPIARSTPANAPVSAGYMTIKNVGTEADRLIGASVTFAGKTEIHEMKMDGDVMKMREIEDGINIPPGRDLTLRPGGFHLMFMQLNQELEPGAKHSAQLTFEKAGTIEVELNIETLAEIRNALGSPRMEMEHSDHGEMKDETKPKAQ